MNIQDIYLEPLPKSPVQVCFKKCACGEEYTEAQWFALDAPAAGGEWHVGKGEVHILRLCKSCRSTLSCEKK